MTSIRKLLLCGVALALCSGTALAQKPADKPADPPKDGGRGPGGGGRGFGGGFAPIKPGTVLPANLITELKLTDEQKKKLEELQKDVDKQLEKLLSDDQKKSLKEIRERGPGGGGFPGGPGGGRPGGDR